ncbi:unnamed protein product, partial [Amoebophrya sp. A120]
QIAAAEDHATGRGNNGTTTTTTSLVSNATSIVRPTELKPQSLRTAVTEKKIGTTASSVSGGSSFTKKNRRRNLVAQHAARRRMNKGPNYKPDGVTEQDDSGLIKNATPATAAIAADSLLKHQVSQASRALRVAQAILRLLHEAQELKVIPQVSQLEENSKEQLHNLCANMFSEDSLYFLGSAKEPLAA